MSNDDAVLKSATPILHARELSEALEWYQQVLGFEITWTSGDPPQHASICRDNAEINLAVPVPGQSTISRVYFETQGVNAYYTRITSHGGQIAVPIGDRPYGMRDFRVVDPTGNELSFGEPTS